MLYCTADPSVRPTLTVAGQVNNISYPVQYSKTCHTQVHLLLLSHDDDDDDDDDGYYYYKQYTLLVLLSVQNVAECRHGSTQNNSAIIDNTHDASTSIARFQYKHHGLYM